MGNAISSGSEHRHHDHPSTNDDATTETIKSKHTCPPMIVDYDWGRLAIKHVGETYWHGISKNEKADCILWYDKYEKWDWKNKDTFVDTRKKYPLKHSPGITPRLLQYMITNSSNYNTKNKNDCPLDKLILSQGFGKRGINSNTPGQLPCDKEHIKYIKKQYPRLQIVECKSKDAIKAWNKSMEKNEKVAMCLHMTC